MSTVKRLHTEQELLNRDEQMVYSMAQLHEKDSTFFKQLVDEMPLFLYFNQVDSLDMTFANQSIQDWMEMEEEEILTRGHDYVMSISDPQVYDTMIRKLDGFKSVGAKNVLTYYQRVFLKGKYRWTLTHKKRISDELFLNLGNVSSQLGSLGDYLNKVLGPAEESQNWDKFKLLTESEKRILEYLHSGMSSELIAEELFISINTVNTHRKNILRKLEVKSTIEALRIFEAFNLVL